MSTAPTVVRVLAVVLLLLLGSLTPAGEVSAQSSPWMARARAGNVVYFFYPDRAERYDLSTRAWLAPAVWPAARGSASAAWADADGLFAVYGQAIFRYALDGTGEQHVYNLNAPINSAGLTSVAGFLVARTAGSFITISKATSQFAAELTYFQGSTGLSSAYNARQVFARSTGSSPSDIQRLTVTANGGMSLIDSPYHGSYPDASQTWVSGDETTVYDSAGTVYATSDLRSRTVLGYTPTEVTHAPGSGAPVVLVGNRLLSYAANLFPIGTFTLASSPTGIVVDGSDVVCFTPGLDSIQVQVVPLASLQGPMPGPALDANGLAYTPDAVLQDKDGVILLLSKALKSVFRWDPSSQQYLASVPLLDAPTHFAYSAPLHRLYLGYANGLIRRIDLGGPSLIEENFALLGSTLTGLVAAGSYCVTVEGVNSTGQIRSFLPDGTQAGVVSRYLLAASEFQWSEALKKIYNCDGAFVHTLAVEPNGSFGATAQFNVQGSFPQPFRISPDGSTIVTAAGGVYNAQTLVRSVNSLGNAIVDTAWVAGAVRTIRNVADQVEFQAWTGPTFSPGTSRQYPGDARRLLPVAGNRLVGISLRSNGVPFLYVVEDSFALVPPPALSAPAGLAARLVSATAAELRWADVPGATGFLIERRQNRGNWFAVGTTTTFVTTFPENGLTTGQEYEYRVSAINGTAVSPPSNALALSVSAPPAPTDLVVTFSSISNIQLAWTAATGTATYVVERKVGASGSYSTIGTTSYASTTFSDGAVSNNFLATYRVRATNLLGTSQPSNTVTVQTPAIVPGAPFISGSSSTATSITLYVSTSNNPDYTFLERRTGAGPWSLIRTLTGSSEVLDAGLTPSTTYSYRARSVNSAGSSGYSFILQAGTTAPQAPLATNLQRARTLSASSIRLTWSDVANELGYRIQRRSGESTQWEQAGLVGADTTSFIDTGLVAGQQQSYRIVPFNEVGEATASNVVDGLAFEVVRLLADNFDPGVHAGVWQQIEGGTALNGGQGFGGSNVLWFGGGSNRSATTTLQNIVSGGYVGFRYRAGNAAVDGSQYWDDAESGEWLVLEVFLDGGWQVLGFYDLQPSAAGTWQSVEIPVPSLALTAPTKFRFRQQSHSGAGLDPWAIDDFYIDGGRPPAPQAPAFVIAGATSDTQIAVAWEAVPGAGYTVERSTGPNGPWSLVVNTLAATYYTDGQLQPATWYAYRVRSENSGGASGFSSLAWAQTYTQLAAWQLANYGSTTNVPAVGPDGVATLLKFALGIPAAGSAPPYLPGSSAGGLPVVWRDAATGRLQMEFLRRKAASNPGVVYQVQFSGDLASWSANAAPVETQSLDAIWERVRFEDPATGPRRMGRLAVEPQ